MISGGAYWASNQPFMKTGKEKEVLYLRICLVINSEYWKYMVSRTIFLQPLKWKVLTVDGYSEFG